MHRALETPVIQLLVFEELDSASSLVTCSKLCRKWHDRGMFIRVKYHRVSLLGLIQTIPPILRNASNGLGGHSAIVRPFMYLHSSHLIGIGANVRSIYFDLALAPCFITLIRGLTRRHTGPIFPRLGSLTILPMIEQWDMNSIFTTFDFLLSISSPITTVTFADGCDSGYARSTTEFFAIGHVPISRLYKGKLSKEVKYLEALGYQFLWHVSQIELHHAPSGEDWIQLSKCEQLEELIICEPFPWVHYSGMPMVTFGHLQFLEVPWTLLPLLEYTIIPKLKQFTLGSARVHSNERPLFASRDRGPDWCKPMLTEASVLALARNCKALVRVELPLTLEAQKSAKSKLTLEDRMRCLRCFRIEVQPGEDSGLRGGGKNTTALRPSHYQLT